LIAVLSFATEHPANAYTDPGSGTLIWQIIVGGLVGLGFEFRRLKNWLTGRKRPSQDSNSTKA
jgi:hypothetical protein